MNNYVIAIGRQMGSGGRELGRLLAQRLGAEFFDKELLLHVAQQSGLIPEIIERNDEREPGFFSGITGFASGMFGTALLGYASPGCDSVYKAQSEIIEQLASQKNCVIVGRTADYLLRNNPRCISIFVHAPEDECVKRLLSRGDKTTEADARTMIRRINKLRSNYYNFYTDRQWGAADSYHLSIDSSTLPMDDLADFVALYVSRRLNL